MAGIFKRLGQRIFRWLDGEPLPLPEWQPGWSDYLQDKVVFYRTLTDADKETFEYRVRHFLATTAVEGGIQVRVTDEDRLLVAASAIIPVWAFPDWHYFNVRSVFLLPGLFNARFECGEKDSLISGMVGTGPMAGKLALSKPHLHAGFDNARDKQNVGIHEFAHLVDGADGSLDGFPERMESYRVSEPWFALVKHKVEEIEKKHTGISDYATVNHAEFFAVASEYFFERPELMQKKHPQLYQWLSEFYHINLAEQYRSARRSH
ncbi:MAG: peptidase [Oceanospirillaceae bacterium]|nr:peptidase [Oceanospirillaceae bacterium]MBT12589.1 peptidase [Oceanospirillaceae bacterium]|tara:strand:+ start:104824 stop:105612 length:789 start_codon:yes stop_codon:yes gene_type:complete